MSSSGDAGAPRRAERLADKPAVVWSCCLLLLGLFVGFALSTEPTRTWALANVAFVPARMAIALDVAHGALEASVQRLPQETFTALIGSGGGRWWTLASYALLHASWPQVLLNVTLLASFGDHVERRLGTVRFVLLLTAAIVVGALVQFAWDAASFMPVVGAAPAVSGVLGAAVRFVFPPGAGFNALFVPTRGEGASARPRLGFVETFTNRPALVVILGWLPYCLFINLFPALSGTIGRPVAWPALATSFLVGVLLFPLLDPRSKQLAAPVAPPTN